MRLSVSTVAFPGVPLVVLPEFATAVGAEGIAVNVSDSSALSLQTPDSEIDMFLRRCRERHVQVSAVYGYAGRKLMLHGPAGEQDIALAKRCVDLSVRLGAPVVRVFASTARGTIAEIDTFVDACRPIVDYAGDVGVKVVFPTHHDLAFDPRSCRRLVEGIGRARAGIIFTGPNMELDGIEPLAALAEMADLVEQVELKDWRRSGDNVEVAVIGAGQATVWPVVEALARTGFGGWVTLHHLKAHDPHLPDLGPDVAAAVRRIIKDTSNRSSHVA
jgi:sugar phosphate isomerase/epimerase